MRACITSTHTYRHNIYPVCRTHTYLYVRKLQIPSLIFLVNPSTKNATENRKDFKLYTMWQNGAYLLYTRLCYIM